MVEKCKTCFFFKSAFPFDFLKGQCHFQWDYCTQFSKYLNNGFILNQIKPINLNPQQIKLFPVNESEIVHSWRGDYKWKPFTSANCQKYISFENAIKILTEEE